MTYIRFPLGRGTSNNRTGICLILACALLAPACAAPPFEARNGTAVPAVSASYAPVQTVSPRSASQRAHTDPASDPKSLGEVSLGGMLAYADEHSPVLLVARSTRSRTDAARAAARPRVPSSPELTVGAGPRFGRSGTGLDVQASLMQQVQVAGERGKRREAAERLGDLTEAEIEQIRWAVHCDVHAAFHRSLVEQERSQLASRVVTFQKEVLRVVERQIAAGEAAPLSLRLAQAEVAQAQQVEVASKQTFLVSRIHLAQLSGWPTSSPPSPGGTVDEPQDPAEAAVLLAVARAHLPSLRAGEARVREAAARAVAADRAGLPRPSVGVSYQREGNPTAEGHYDTVMGIVSLPIPGFQANQAERAGARADVSVAEAELAGTLQLLEGRIAEARSEAVAAAQRVRAYRAEILPRFEENLTLLRRSFELGEIDLLALSMGRERFLRIQSDALGAQLDYFIALAGLERIVGVDLWHDDHHSETNP